MEKDVSNWIQRSCLTRPFVVLETTACVYEWPRPLSVYGPHWINQSLLHNCQLPSFIVNVIIIIFNVINGEGHSVSSTTTSLKTCFRCFLQPLSLPASLWTYNIQLNNVLIYSEYVLCWMCSKHSYTLYICRFIAFS